jgi:hypothetical protein
VRTLPVAVAVAGLVAAAAAAAAPAAAGVRRVPADHATIQAAIDAAADGDAIEVSDGTYQERISFKGKAIAVRSVHGAAATIVDGGGQGAVVAFSGESAEASLTGFTIRNGKSELGLEGGGISLDHTAATVARNVITQNTGCDGIGIGIIAGSPVVAGNLITMNQRAGCSGGSGGGGISVRMTSTAQILGNTITHNTIGGSGAGGAISLFAAGNVTIRGNVISDNTAATQGGAIVMVNESTPVIADNLIIHNTAGKGGGIWALVPSGSAGPRIVNNTIAGNTAVSDEGSELFFEGFYEQTQIWNNLILGATARAATACATTSTAMSPAFLHNDGFNPAGPAYIGSCVAVTGTSGNISVDPKLVDPATNFRLAAGSPAIDAGSNDAPDLPADDLAGFIRILDGDASGTATVDIGAYEAGGGTALGVTPTSVAFATQLLGGPASAPQTATLMNKGDGPVALTKIEASGDFTTTTTCGDTLAHGASCTVSIAFAPTAAGLRTGALTIIDDAPGSPHAVTLIGAATDFTIEPSPLGAASAEVEPGSPAHFDLEVSSLGGFSGNVALSCAGAPDTTTCAILPGTVTVAGGDAVAFTVTVTTAAPGTRSAAAVPGPDALARGTRWRGGPLAVLAVLAVFSALAAASARRRGARGLRRRWRFTAATLISAALAAGAVAAGCNHSVDETGFVDARPGSGSPPGTYPLTITGTSGGRTKTLALSLTIRA